MRTLLAALALALAAFAWPEAGAAPASAAEAPAVLTLRGLGGESVQIGAAELAAAPQRESRITLHGVAHRYQGVLLSDLLARVGAPRGAALSGAHLQDVVLVRCRDGYTIVLALAETDPAFRSDAVLLAYMDNGAPLGADDGPFRLVVEGEARAARSARMVVSIELVRVGAPQPSAPRLGMGARNVDAQGIPRIRAQGQRR